MPHDTTQSSGHSHDCHSGCGCGEPQEHGPRPPVAQSEKPWRPHDFVRPITIGIFRKDAHILAGPVHDDEGQIKGWRPLGGGIEFGESAKDALKRELQEETQQTISVGDRLGVLENLFEHHGVSGHEIVFVYEATFTESAVYEADQLAFVEGDKYSEAKWVPIAKAKAGRMELYPTGLADLL